MKSTDVLTLDCGYLQPQFAAAFLLVENGRATFIENNTAHSVPILLQALKSNGLAPSDVDFIIITHVHLDHAGGTSALLEACPKATVLAHPRAAPHLIDPVKLIGSAEKVYGKDRFKELYGEIKPIESTRIRVMEDGEILSWGSRKLTFIYTRGHANHHFCVLDSGSESVFTGDSFGLAYPALQKEGLFIFPSTSPTDYEPTEARNTVKKIAGLGVKRAYLTHFGEVSDIEAAASQLLLHLEASEGVLLEAVNSPLEADDLSRFCLGKLREYYSQYGQNSPLLDLDLELNGAGIAHTAQKNRTGKMKGK